MSKPWEFSVSPARLSIIAGCLAGAGLIIGAAGFTAGLILAPTYSPVFAEAVKREQARVAALKSDVEKKPEVAVAKVEAPKPPDAKPAEAPKPPEAAKPAEEAKPAEAAKKDEPKPAPKPPIQLQVQVASFSSQANADSTVNRLKRSGYPAFAVSWTDPSSREWHVVQVGPYYAYDAAAKTVLELSNAYRVSPVIISTRTSE